MQRDGPVLAQAADPPVKEGDDTLPGGISRPAEGNLSDPGNRRAWRMGSPEDGKDNDWKQGRKEGDYTPTTYLSPLNPEPFPAEGCPFPAVCAGKSLHDAR